jgi:hypothetical protein
MGLWALKAYTDGAEQEFRSGELRPPAFAWHRAVDAIRGSQGLPHEPGLRGTQ